jgi:hypothetical protein
MSLLHKTTAACDLCDQSHPARLIREGDDVIGVMDCPAGERRHRLSSDADLFMALRARSQVRPERPVPKGLRHVINYLSLTNGCNFSCSVCAADACSQADATFISLAEVRLRAEQAWASGARVLHLFGGEPTLHPQLLEIVRVLVAHGFSLGLVTNGLKLAQEPDLAPALVRAGLKRVCLQFDSLNTDTLDRLKRSHLPAKRDALEAAAAAGLQVGLNCTATRHNLPEIAELLNHGLAAGTAVRNMTFGTAAAVGRFLIDTEESVDRESVIKALVSGDSGIDLQLEDISPLPRFLPLGMDVHPECGVHLVLVRTPVQTVPLNRWVDVDRAYAHLAGVPGGVGRWRAVGSVVRALWRAARPGCRGKMLGVAWSLLLRRPGTYLVNVGISDYRAAAFLDEQRLSRCASAFHTSVGAVSGCQHFFRGPGFRGSREYEVAHGSC